MSRVTHWEVYDRLDRITLGTRYPTRAAAARDARARSGPPAYGFETRFVPAEISTTTTVQPMDVRDFDDWRDTGHPMLCMCSRCM